MALIAQSHLLLMLLYQSKGHFLLRLLSELVFVFSLNYKCKYVHLEARVPHVRGSLTCVPWEIQRLLTKKESLWELKISFLNNPQDFLQEINCYFVFCNIKKQLLVHFWDIAEDQNIFGKRINIWKETGCFIFSVLIRLLFILWVDVMK
jgi:hypothetical protein